MRIAHIVSTYPPYKSGMGNVAQAFVKELNKKGHKNEVFTPFYSAQGEIVSQSDIHRLRPLFSYGNSAFVPKIYSSLKGFDLIHLHYPFFGGAEAVALFKWRNPKVPLVITYHMDVVGSGWLKSFFQLYGRFIFPLIIKKADAVTVSSLDYAENSNLLKSEQVNKLTEIPFGVDEKFRPDESKRNEGSIDLIFVAALDKAHYFKGLDVLLDSFADLCKDSGLNNIVLHIVGEGDMRGQYEAQADDLGIKGRVVFHGKVSDDQLIVLYQSADINLKPSVDRSEAFGATSIEAMACGAPVIASNLPGVRSVIEEGRTGLLVEPGDKDSLASAMKALITDDTLRSQMSAASLKRIKEKYRWPKIIEKLEKVYENCLNQQSV